MLPIAMLAMAEVLARLSHTMKALVFAWPSELVIDGVAVGRARLALPKPGPDPLPLCLVAGLELELRSAALSQDERPQVALEVASIADLTAAAIVEAFARQFLVWVQGWQPEGLDSVATVFQERLFEPAGETARIDPQTFDLVRTGPPEEREGLAEGLLLGGVPLALR